ncbi:NAD(P)H-hydrate dehydratase [Rhodobacterales bacterium HKCCE2091]|nr:NAD(P)H-hydrate dehydratase [Rhodobacterales bacterium HKCCE2091]
MTELLTAAGMRAAERVAMDSGRVTGLELMERAGRAVVDAIFAEWPVLAAAPHRAVVLCGPGNNGGDGFVIARLLRQAAWQVEVFLSGDPAKLPPDARVNHDRWCAQGTVTLTETPEARADAGLGLRPQEEEKGAPDLYIDAVFGTGLTRPVDTATVMGGRYLGVLAGTTGAGTPPGRSRVVAVDIPSGLCADSGRVLGQGVAPFADLTVTFHRAKLGHYLADGPARCGKVVVADIGIGSVAPGDHAPVPLVTRADLMRDGPAGAPGLKRGGHKYDHGHALILSGGMGRSGAARLAARAALRIGAGLVTVAAPGSAMLECACHLTAVMLRKCDGAEDLASLLEDTRLSAICLGPGLGVDRAREAVSMVLGTGRAAVLDADALTAFADAPDALFGMLHPRVVLTPHMGEFSRLFPDIADRLSAPATAGPAVSRLDAAREAAARAGAAVLLKGPDTVIAAPDGSTRVHSAAYDRAAPWLATAGAGDVLAGLIAGLLARGIAPPEAAAAAAWLHLEAARDVGPGLIAEDLPERIPKVLSRLQAAG